MAEAACPHCGGALAGPTVHRGELERQYPAQAAELRTAAMRAGRLEGNHDRPAAIGTGFVVWRGYVWTVCTIRKPATCCISGEDIPAGGRAWRQLSEQRDRDLRVHLTCWAHLL